MARVRRKRGTSADLVEAAGSFLPHFLKFYKRFEEKRPVMLLDLQSQKIYAYPYEEFKAKLGVRSQMMLAADYEKAIAKNKEQQTRLERVWPGPESAGQAAIKRNDYDVGEPERAIREQHDVREEGTRTAIPGETQPGSAHSRRRGLPEVF